MSRPRICPEWSQINSIDASPHDAGTAYVAATMYKLDDFRPYLFNTDHDYGKTWTTSSAGFRTTTSRAWCAKIPIARVCW